MTDLRNHIGDLEKYLNATQDDLEDSAENTTTKPKDKKVTH